MDVPLLRKMVEKVTTDIPKFSDVWACRFETPIGKESHWYQSDWILLLDNSDYVKPAQAVITEQGIFSGTMGRCGTAACLAGQTVLDTAPVGTKITGHMVTLPNGDRHSVSEYARMKLGLSYHQADRLFAGTNKADNLRAYSEQFIAEYEASCADD